MKSITDISYTLKEVTKDVYLVTFKTAYDVAMTFCRVQEFYESPKFRGKFVRFTDYAREYALENKGIFTYTDDWRGFNVPGAVIHVVHSKLCVEQYDTINDYDEVLMGIVNRVQRRVQGRPFYLIGTSKEKGDKSVQRHEIAHGLYTTNKKYRSSVDMLIAKMSSKVKHRMYKSLEKLKYHKSVWHDELNAYFSTELTAEMSASMKERRPFINLLKRMI